MPAEFSPEQFDALIETMHVIAMQHHTGSPEFVEPRENLRKLLVGSENTKMWMWTYEAYDRGGNGVTLSVVATSSAKAMAILTKEGYYQLALQRKSYINAIEEGVSK